MCAEAVSVGVGDALVVSEGRGDADGSAEVAGAQAVTASAVAARARRREEGRRMVPMLERSGPPPKVARFSLPDRARRRTDAAAEAAAASEV
jgi:hypothetical protein